MNDEITIVASQDEAKAEKKVADEEISGYLLLEKDVNQGLKGTYKANQISDSMISNDLLLALTQLKSKIQQMN